MLLTHFTLAALVAFAASSPLVVPEQEVLAPSPSRPSVPTGKPEYSNGETPPMEDNIGWVDPRLNGGRFLDVRTALLLTEGKSRTLTAGCGAVHDAQIRRAAEHHHLRAL